MIQFQNVTKSYPGNDFKLSEVSFSITPGEFVFLIGPSGSGKTSLIRLLIREELPSTGQIYLDDYDITKLTRQKVYRLRRQIGVIFQDYKLIPDKNTYENVAFAMEVAGRSDKEVKETVPYVLDIVGLGSRAGAFPSYLSGGEKQRVAIARAISNNPRVLIADEPTGNLDPASAWDIVQILSKINNWGTTVIMSTHGTDIVNSLNKRVIQMDKGHVVRDDNKGFYEITQANTTTGKQEEAASPSRTNRDESSGPIKVTIKRPEKEHPKKERGFLLKLLGWGKEKEFYPEPEFGHPNEPNQDAQTYVDEETISTVALDIENVSEKEAQKIIQEADRTPIERLRLRPEVIADLRTAGYKDVEDLIETGPEDLEAELMIDPQEVVLVSQAIAEFVANENDKLSNEVVNESKDAKVENQEKKENTKETEENKKTEQKVTKDQSKKGDTKVQLTAKKKKS